MKIYSICCTYNRHFLLERVVRCFIDQDYEGDHSLIIYNTGRALRLDDNISMSENKHIYLFNNHIDVKTGRPYTTVGDKHRDALSLIEDADIISHISDDDYFTKDHISLGVKGLLNSDEEKVAYKPLNSLFRCEINKIELTQNNMEPSIFMYLSHLKKFKYLSNSVNYHNSWYFPLLEKNIINIEKEGKPTYIYEWSGETPVWKMSGSGKDDDKNFQTSQSFEKDYGDGIITPLSEGEMKRYYNIIPNN